MGGVGKPVRRYPLRKRDARALLEEISSNYPGFPLREVEVVEMAEFDDVTLYILDRRVAFFRRGGRLLPSLTFLLDYGYSWLPQVYVDRGAAKAMVRGADLMAPGVRSINGDFNVGSIVVIVDEESKAPIAIGEALLDSRGVSELVARSAKGKVFKNLHHVGDRIWSMARSLG
jgi:PUA domain protein